MSSCIYPRQHTLICSDTAFRKNVAVDDHRLSAEILVSLGSDLLIKAINAFFFFGFIVKGVFRISYDAILKKATNSSYNCVDSYFFRNPDKRSCLPKNLLGKNLHFCGDICRNVKHRSKLHAQITHRCNGWLSFQH